MNGNKKSDVMFLMLIIALIIFLLHSQVFQESVNLLIIFLLFISFIGNSLNLLTNSELNVDIYFYSPILSGIITGIVIGYLVAPEKFNGLVNLLIITIFLIFVYALAIFKKIKNNQT